MISSKEVEKEAEGENMNSSDEVGEETEGGDGSYNQKDNDSPLDVLPSDEDTSSSVEIVNPTKEIANSIEEVLLSATEEVVSLAEQFIQLGKTLDLVANRDIEILDVACGVGVVGEELRAAGYKKVDGLDPCQAYLDGGVARGIFRKTFREFLDPVKPTSIPDCAYDALLCCAGFFQGLISPRAFPELIRITKPGGIIAWNIASGYEHYADYDRYDEIVMDLVRHKQWCFARPVIKNQKMCFTDCGASYLRGFSTTGGIQCEGFTYIMRKL